MNVLILVNNYPPRINSAAHLYSDLSVTLVEMGHAVQVITEDADNRDTPTYHRRGFHDFFYTEKYRGVIVHRVPTLSFLRKGMIGKGLRFLCAFVLFLLRALLVNRPDIILVFSPELYMGTVGLISSRMRNCPFVLNIQDMHPQVLIDMGIVKSYLVKKLFFALERINNRGASRIIVYSVGNKYYLTNKHINEAKIHIIPNWVDINEIKPMEKKNIFRMQHNIGERFVVSYAGSMQRAQGLESVVLAAEILREKEDILFLLIGGGEANSFLREITLQKRLLNIRFLPFQKRELYPDVLAASDVTILALAKDLPPYEVPGKLPNLMASGRPIIVSVNKNGDAAHIIKAAMCGICVEPGDPKELAKAVLELYTNRERCRVLGNNGRVYAVSHFSRQRCIDQYAEVMQKANL